MPGFFVMEKILNTTPSCLDMDGNAWEGYQWVDGWPVTPPRQQQAPAAPTEPANEPVNAPEHGPEMVVDATPATDAVDNISSSNAIASSTIEQVTHTQNVSKQDETEKSAAGSDYTGTSYAHSLLSDSEEDEVDPDIIKLGNSYSQVRAAREASMTVEITDISCNENALVTEKKRGFRVGTMDKNINNEINNCFKGVRIEKNGNLVNQYLSCSFDPSTNICITCSSEHSIWGGGDSSVCFVLSDQNFVATLPGGEGKDCLKIVRIENSSLTELANIFLEIMEYKTVKPGTCILLTSLSHLSRVGAAAYAAEWRVAVNMLVSRWAGVLVCPVFPLHFSEIPGPLFGELLILHAWYKKMYAGTTLGLQSSWSRYTEILLEFAEGAGSLDQPELITPLLPSSLDPRSNFVPTHFSTSSTSPSIIFGLDRKSAYELLLSLTVSLRRGLSISANPEAILARDTAATCEGAKENKSMTIILAGASNLASLRPVFESNGAVVVDLTKPGWMITESNVELLKKELMSLSNMEDAAIIFDLFGNSAYRFRHVDGSLVLPFRVGGGYHLLGDIQMVSDSGVGDLLNMVKPLFALCALFLTVIMPPLPRYIFSGCCREAGHSTNIGNDGYSGRLLDECLHFRKVLKTSLVGMEGLGRFWLTDSLSCLGLIPPTMQEKLDSLRMCLSGDGVHLTEQGRFNLFNSLAKTILGLRDGSIGKPPKTAEAAACSLISGRKFFWRGFESDRGSAMRPPTGRGGGGRGRGGGRGTRVTPYSRQEAAGRGGSHGGTSKRGGK